MTDESVRRVGAAQVGALVVVVGLVGAGILYRTNRPDVAPGYTSKGMDAVPMAGSTASAGAMAGAKPRTPSARTPLRHDATATAARTTTRATTRAAARAAIGATPSAESVSALADTRAGTAATPSVSPRGGDPTPTMSIASRPTTTGPPPPDGLVPAMRPYLSLARPFDATDDVRPSRYYPYGTDAGGQYLLHHGVDIGNPTGTLVHAVADGFVVFAGRDDERAWGPYTDFYGQLVVLEHEAALDGAPLSTLYGHLSRVLVDSGDRVVTGQPIAEVGAEGIALGPHLHLEARQEATDYGSTVNPELLLKPLAGHGLIVGRVFDAAGSLVPGQQVNLHAASGDGAGQWLAQTTTYPHAHVNSADGWHETFVFGDLAEGQYWVSSEMDGDRVGAPATVTDGEAWSVTLSLIATMAATETATPTRTPTPSATPTMAPAATWSPKVSQPN